jgi:nucleoside-diphosphate-sugar epimerase
VELRRAYKINRAGSTSGDRRFVQAQRRRDEFIQTKNFIAGRLSTINGTGEQTRDCVYVEDVARAHVLASEKNGVPSGAYNIGTGSEASVKELYEQLVEISGAA